MEAGIPEDDPRNPAVIADNVGDNVGDVAGMGADLFGSYVATVLAAMVLGNYVISDMGGSIDDPFGGIGPILLPMSIAGLGIIISLIGATGSFFIYFVMNGVASHFIREQTGVLLEPFKIDFTFIYVFLSILALGIISALPTAFLAYRVDISKNLRSLT